MKKRTGKKYYEGTGGVTQCDNQMNNRHQKQNFLKIMIKSLTLDSNGKKFTSLVQSPIFVMCDQSNLE